MSALCPRCLNPAPSCSCPRRPVAPTSLLVVVLLDAMAWWGWLVILATLVLAPDVQPPGRHCPGQGTVPLADLLAAVARQRARQRAQAEATAWAGCLRSDTPAWPTVDPEEYVPEPVLGPITWATLESPVRGVLEVASC